MSFWCWKIANEELFSLLNKENKENEKINFFNFKKKEEYKVKSDDFFKSFYRVNNFNFLLNKENQRFLFYSVFADFLNDKKNDFIVKSTSLEYNDQISSSQVKKLKDKGVEIIFENIGTHSNSSFYTSSKNTIYYKNKIGNKTGFSALKISKTPFYFASINASDIPLVKAFTARVGDFNILDILISNEEKYETFVKLFIDTFGADFHSELKNEYERFINGEYNKSEVTGIEKQILIPDESSETGYVSISPVSSHNIGFFLNPLLYEKGKLLNANMKSIGGTQPQNTSYVNSLLGGKLINFKMSFPQNQKSEADYLLFNINKRNTIPLDLGKDLNRLNSLLEKEEIPNDKKEKIKNNFINAFSDEFLGALLILNNQRDKITNQNYLRLISFEMGYNEIRDYLSILVENSINPKRYKKELTKELRNEIVNEICKNFGELNE